MAHDHAQERGDLDIEKIVAADAKSSVRRLWRLHAGVCVPLISALIVGVFEFVVGCRLTVQQGLPDPDSYMRIVRIRDGIEAGGFTRVVAGDSGGAGTILHWSHLIDGLILTLRQPFRLAWDGDLALYYAAAVTGPLFAAAFAAALVWAVAPLARARFLFAAPLVAVLSPYVFYNGVFGYVGHHLPLALMAVLAAGSAGRAAAGRVAPGAWCGICAAVAIWFSPEAVPYMLMAIGAVGVAWCLRPTETAAPLAACGTAFAVATTAVALIDPPYGGRLSAEVDCISIVYATLALLVCGAAWLLIRLDRPANSVLTRFFRALVAGAAVAGVWTRLCPSVAHGLAGWTPGYDLATMFRPISQMQPLTLDAYGVALVGTGLIGVLAASTRALMTRSVLWGYAAGCGVVVVALATAYIRFAIYAEAIDAMMAPVVLEWVSAMRLRPARQSLLRTSALIVFLLPTYAPVAAAWAPGRKALPVSMANCDVRDIVQLVGGQTRPILLTEITDTPEILWRTQARTVGSLYPRGIDAFLRARAAWRSPPSEAVPDAVLRTGATHILACDLNRRSSLVDDLPPTTLQDRLSRHEAPAWLSEIGRAGGYRLYAIETSRDPAAPGAAARSDR